jgi:hypothetical protein
MTDAARVARLTEMARKVPCWEKPFGRGRSCEVVIQPGRCTAVFAVEEDGADAHVLLDTAGDVDALEAALCTLAREPTSWATKRAHHLLAMCCAECRKGLSCDICFARKMAADELLAAARGERGET